MVRRAEPADGAALARLRRRMVEEESGLVADPGFEGRFEAFWLTASASRRWVATIAWDADEIVGNVWLQLVQRVPRPGEREPSRSGT